MSLEKQFVKAKKTCKVTFSVPMETLDGAKEVLLLGDFNQWEPKEGIPMKLTKDKFTATMELNPGQEYEFRYLIDNKFWTNDRDADKFAPTPFGVENSVVVIPTSLEN